MNAIIEEINAEQLKGDVPEFEIGDTVRVHVRIIEGDKERIQALTGTVIARKGRGLSETFSIYRVAYGASMERVFPIHSPRVAKIEVLRKAKVRKSKLYYLRGAQGKKARLAERITTKKERAEKAAKTKTAEEPKAEVVEKAEPKTDEALEEPVKDNESDKSAEE